jgi:3-methyladenine DNA glycosylase Tag
MNVQETNAYLSGYKACQNDVESVIESVLRKGSNARTIQGLVEAFNELQAFLWDLNSSQPPKSNTTDTDDEVNGDSIVDEIEKLLTDNGYDGNIIAVTINKK